MVETAGTKLQARKTTAPIEHRGREPRDEDSRAPDSRTSKGTSIPILPTWPTPAASSSPTASTCTSTRARTWKRSRTRAPSAWTITSISATNRWACTVPRRADRAPQAEAPADRGGLRRRPGCWRSCCLGGLVYNTYERLGDVEKIAARREARARGTEGKPDAVTMDQARLRRYPGRGRRIARPRCPRPSRFRPRRCRTTIARDRRRVVGHRRTRRRPSTLPALTTPRIRPWPRPRRRSPRCRYPGTGRPCGK